MLEAMRCLPLVLVMTAGTAFADTGQSKIIGGTATTDGEWPSVVVIEVGHGLCSGALLTPDWVITAAHCVTASVVGETTQKQVTDSARIHFGTIDITKAPGTVATASETFPDPFFDAANPVTHDTGLIHLTTPVTDVTPVPVNFDASKATIGVMVTQVGFGDTGVGPSGMPGKEFEVSQRSVSCGFIGSGALDANLLCFDQSGGMGTCEGDSGGPMFATIDGTVTQVALTSFGDPMCAKFGGDTRLDAGKLFIISHVPELQGPCTDSNASSVCGNNESCFDGGCVPAPLGEFGLGTTCKTSAECASTECAAGPDGMRCTAACTKGGSDCPSDFDCLDTGGDQGACWPSAGCCSGSRGAPTMFVAGAFVVFTLRRRKRR